MGPDDRALLAPRDDSEPDRTTVAFAGPPRVNTRNLIVGEHDGKLDDFRLWVDIERTEEQIRAAAHRELAEDASARWAAAMWG